MNDDSVVQKLETKVSISHTLSTIQLDQNRLYFSEVESRYTDKKPNDHKGVLKYHSLSSLLERLHTSSATAKDKAPAILKGIYKGGTSGQYCIEGSPFLFFDIDVKEHENKHLFDAKLNADVFEQLEKISVLVWRSNSQLGIAGILYVPELCNYLHTNRGTHLQIGNSITNYLSNDLGLNATFDQAQSKFRQIRLLAHQKETRELNTQPYRFNVNITQDEVKTQSGTPQFHFSNGRAAYGTIQQQFNEQNNIHTALLDCNFKQISSTRYLHPLTTSKTTGEVVKGNIFISNSTSFDSQNTVFTPYWLYFKCGNYSSLQDFNEYLKQQGYKPKLPTKNILRTAKIELNKDKNNRNEQIFKACYDLQNLPYSEKRVFAKENAQDESELPIFYDYLKLKPLTIYYDKKLTINKYVAECLSEILDYSDENHKLIVKAETGTGKTTAFLRDFKKLRPSTRLLILAPLTVIVDQTKSKYDNIVTLTGVSEPQQHTLAKTSTIVMATYEQGIKHLRDKNNFDYIVIDEAHNLITANNYKSKTIKELTQYLRNKKVIGLTGTPNLLFRSIGYKSINIKRQQQAMVEVTMRIDNRDSAKIIIQHISKIKGKAIIRLNNVDNLKEIKKELAKGSNYTDNEIIIFQSTKGVKQSADFKQLTSESRFRDNIKIVLTTGIIDEGLSIEQYGFTDVLFIENQYNPNPEPMKQFFARFRNEDVNRTNYYYYKEKKSQYLSAWSPYYDFNNRVDDLKKDIVNRVIDLDTGMNSANNDKLFYNSGAIDHYALANEVSVNFFKLLTSEEYILFLKLNYNLELVKDEDYLKLVTDIGTITENKRTNKNTIIKNWSNQFEQIEFALHNLTEDKNLKKTIEYNGEDIKYEILDLVNSNLKSFEFLYKARVTLLALEVKDINVILFPDGKFNKQKINREIKLLQNLNTIENPKTKTEQKNAKKLIAFVDEVTKLERFKIGDLIITWKKQRVSSLNISSYDLIDLVLHFKKYKRCSKTNTYIAIK